MEILLLDTTEVITEQEFRNMYPNTSFPVIITKDILEEFDAVALMEGPQATTTSPYEYSFRDGIQEINGKWFTKYSIGPVFTDTDDKTAEDQELEYRARIDEQQATAVRNQRNQLLKDSDWTQVNDAPVDQAAWAEYRQELRDITAQEGFPFTLEWPIAP